MSVQVRSDADAETESEVEEMYWRKDKGEREEHWQRELPTML